jgi:hypothetical protein
MSLHASIVNVQSPRRLDFKPLKLLNIDLNADLDPDPGFHSNPEPYPAFKNNTDPDPLPCTYHRVDMFCTLCCIMVGNCHGPLFAFLDTQINTSVVDPHHFDADTGADPDWTYHRDADLGSDFLI